MRSILELAERRKEAFEDVLEKRSEINREVRAREDESLEALRARKAELEAKLEALRKPNIISERIAMAYPKLFRGPPLRPPDSQDQRAPRPA